MCNVKLNYIVNVLCHIAIMAHKVHIGQHFDSFLAFESFKERYQNTEYVQFYRRDSRTVEAPVARCPKKTLNPAIKFYEATYHCVRGGKKHKPTGTGKKETRSKYPILSYPILGSSYPILSYPLLGSSYPIPSYPILSACWFIYSIQFNSSYPIPSPPLPSPPLSSPLLSSCWFIYSIVRSFFSFISCIRSFNLLLIHSFILLLLLLDTPNSRLLTITILARSE